MYYETVLPFGKHRGRRLGAVPLSYLTWLWEECDLKPYLREAVKGELRRRLGPVLGGGPAYDPPPPAPADWHGVVKTWFARLARQYHPDVGGSDEEMRVVNNARDLLLEMVGR